MLNICYVAFNLEQKSVHWMKLGLKFMFHCVDMLESTVFYRGNFGCFFFLHPSLNKKIL